MLQRIWQALRMDAAFYQRAAGDSSLNVEAAILLILVTFLQVVGSLPSLIRDQDPGVQILLIIAVPLLGPVCTLTIELAFAGAVVLVGRTVLGGEGSFGGVFRTLAYAWTPNALDILAPVPVLGDVCWWIGSLWSLLLAVIAVREAMGFSTAQAVGTFVLILAIPCALGLGATVIGVGE